jgi:hypothetical protein
MVKAELIFCGPLSYHIKAFLKRSRNETDESEELIVLVARKCVQVYTETLNSSVKAKQKQKEIS